MYNVYNGDCIMGTVTYYPIIQSYNGDSHLLSHYPIDGYDANGSVICKITYATDGAPSTDEIGYVEYDYNLQGRLAVILADWLKCRNGL